MGLKKKNPQTVTMGGGGGGCEEKRARDRRTDVMTRGRRWGGRAREEKKAIGLRGQKLLLAAAHTFLGILSERLHKNKLPLPRPCCLAKETQLKIGGKFNLEKKGGGGGVE